MCRPTVLVFFQVLGRLLILDALNFLAHSAAPRDCSDELRIGGERFHVMSNCGDADAS